MKPSRKSTWSCLLNWRGVAICLALIGEITSSAAPSPTLIPFQGRLTNPQGVPYTNGQYTISFTLYDQAVGGSALWSETHAKVGVINGMVNVFLGSINSLAALDFGRPLHLGITIDADNNPNTADPEMIPRQMIIPAFWAKNSEKLAGYDWSAILVGAGTNPASGKISGSKIESSGITSLQLADNSVTTSQLGPNAVTAGQLAPNAITSASIANGAVGSNQIAIGAVGLQQLSQAAANVLVPPGSITAYAGDAIPTGWLPCNGQAVSRTTYSNLWTAIGRIWGVGDGSATFNLPDLQGMFLRGVDVTAGQDPDKASRTAPNSGGNAGPLVGSLQADEFKSHNHNPPGFDRLLRVSGNFTVTSTDPGQQVELESAGGIIEARGGNETRPKNAYVVYIIKY